MQALDRRTLLTALAAAAAGGALRPPAAAAAQAALAAAGLDDDDDPGSFYTRWPYAQPSDVLPWVKAKAARGDAQAVLDALDEWAT